MTSTWPPVGGMPEWRRAGLYHPSMQLKTAILALARDVGEEADETGSVVAGKDS